MSNKSKKAPSKGSNVFGSDSSDDEETSVQKVNTSLRSSRKSWVAKQVCRHRGFASVRWST